MSSAYYLPLSHSLRLTPHWFKRRRLYLAGGLTLLLLSGLYFLQRSLKASDSDSPPLYKEYHHAELLLTQQVWNKTGPSEDEKFFFVAGHTRGLGWGNAIQEHLLNAYLAYRSGRRLVFGNYTWDDNGSLYAKYNHHKIPSQIPYSALIRGPAVGGPFSVGENAQLAVTKEYFDRVCPVKLALNLNHVQMSVYSQNSAARMTNAWEHVLRDTDNPCVESSKRSGPIYDHEHIFGERGSLEGVWADFAASPIITYFGWSTLVELAFDTNREHFLPPSSLSLEPYLASLPFATNAERYTMIPGLMVLHVRWGDYKGHCKFLAKTSEDFVSVNTFPNMMDQFPPPPRPKKRVKPTSEVAKLYMRRCYPTVQDIVDKVVDVRQTPAARDVRRLYIMTNGSPAFIRELKDALQTAAHWEGMSSSRDLVLNRQQKYIAQAIDQMVAQRAQVFIGNGFLTLTSNAVMMRLANGFPRTARGSGSVGGILAAGNRSVPDRGR